MHVLMEMVLFALRKSEISLGVVTDERHKAMNERLTNTKYIGE